MHFQIDLKDLLQAGTHFGHQTRRWNPRMQPYIYSQRDGIHIIDLQKTVEQAKQAAAFISDIVAQGHSVLFVGTKKQASEVIRQEAERVGQFYVNNRWLGGTLTNFKTIKASIDRLNGFYSKKEKGELEQLTKREQLQIDRTIQKLEASLGGIKMMTRFPGAIFIVDPNVEDIAKREAKKLRIPIVAMIDTNGDPDGIDFPIPSNDDAIRSIQYFTHLIATACEDGMKRYEAELQKRERDAEKEGKRAPSAAKEKKVGGVGKAYTAMKPKEKGENLSKEELESFAKASAEDA